MAYFENSGVFPSYVAGSELALKRQQAEQEAQINAMKMQQAQAAQARQEQARREYANLAAQPGGITQQGLMQIEAKYGDVGKVPELVMKNTENTNQYLHQKAVTVAQMIKQDPAAALKMINTDPEMTKYFAGPYEQLTSDTYIGPQGVIRVTSNGVEKISGPEKSAGRGGLGGNRTLKPADQQRIAKIVGGINIRKAKINSKEMELENLRKLPETDINGADYMRKSYELRRMKDIAAAEDERDYNVLYSIQGYNPVDETGKGYSQPNEVTQPTAPNQQAIPTVQPNKSITPQEAATMALEKYNASKSQASQSRAVDLSDLPEQQPPTPN